MRKNVYVLCGKFELIKKMTESLGCEVRPNREESSRAQISQILNTVYRLFG